MERSSTPTRRVTPSDPASSQKRTSSPGAFTPSIKKLKPEPSQGNSDKDKKRRRKRKQPITRDVEMSSGLALKDHSSSHLPGTTLPMASTSTQKGSSTPNSVSGELHPISPPSRSPVTSPSPLHHETSRPESPGALQQESAMKAIYSEHKSLHDHKALIASLISSMICQICLDLLHKPFALTPCGHVSCYSCLINWFNADRQTDELEGDHVFRKKTCPQCRVVVRGRPIEAWNIKDMVASVVKSGLAPDFPRPTEVNSNEAASRGLAGSEPPSRDPWANVFPPLPSHTGLSSTGVPPDAFGMFDAEDQVYRCLDCMHEVWGRSCSHCGRHYDGHNDDSSEDEAPIQERNGLWGILPVMEQIMGWPRVAGVGGSDDGSYEASFIDDDGSDGGISEAIEIMSDSSNPVTEVTPLTSGQDRDGTANILIPSSDKEEEVGETDGLQVVTRHSEKRRTRLQVLSDNDEADSETDEKSSYHDNAEDDGDGDGDGSLARPPMRLFGRVCSQLSFRSESDSDDSPCTELDDCDNVDCDEHVSSVPWDDARDEEEW